MEVQATALYITSHVSADWWILSIILPGSFVHHNLHFRLFEIPYVHVHMRDYDIAMH